MFGIINKMNEKKFMKIFTDDIVISGMSGRFPESNSTDEFAQNLYNKVDMITEDNRRWPTDVYGMSQRMGKLKDIDKFDGLFFGIMDAMADTIDPQSRLLLETTYEAIIDAGINPQTLRGTQTGVYIGYSSFGMPEGIPEETQPDSQNSMTETLLWIPGNSKCLYSNRISFVFDFKGPSLFWINYFKVHIQCSLVMAERRLQTGNREAKVVAQIWSQLGVDPKTTPDNMNLGEIGMESMFAVELQQGLERDYGIKVALNDIKFITVKLLKDFESGKIDELRKYAEEVKISRNKLSKYRFLIPTDIHTRLNSVKTGKPIYFLPPIDGIFASLEPLAEKLKRPVIGLNWTKELDKMSSMKEIHKYYRDLLKTMSPKEDYDLLGTLDNGGVVIIKMLPKSPINRALLLDTISELNLDDRILSEVDFLEMSLSSFWKTLPLPLQEKFRRDIRSNKDFDTKVAKLGADIRDFGGKCLVSRDLEEILNNSIRRGQMLTNYRINMRKKFNKMKYKIGQRFLEVSGKLLIIKLSEKGAENSVKDSDQIDSEFYCLPEKEMKDKLSLESIDEIKEEFSYEKVVLKVNEYFS